MTNDVHALEAITTWFGLSRRVKRLDYIVAGCVLMVLKYAVEVSVFWIFADALLTPLDFVNPLLAARERMLTPAPPWLPWLLYLWTLPFLWVAVSMSIRRAADAGGSPWIGFLMLVPLVNLFVMLALFLWPSAEGEHWAPIQSASVVRETPWHGAISVALGVLLGGVMIAISIYGLSSYGSSLFVGTPLLMGATSAWFYNRRQPHSFAASAGLGAVAVLCGFLGMFSFALEGVICLIMTIPVAVPVAAFGGLLGKAIADTSRRPAIEVATTLLMLPLWTYGEAYLAKEPERVVLTTVEIEAPPGAVWNNVVSFPDLPAERSWYFRLGIACPERARIDGQGVGAVRRCEFSTGTFIEPITTWDEPRRLAFDVTDQPPPMFELSPYSDVNPPHLTGFLHSTHGEFRLVELPSGRTRLEGRTWYRCATYPTWYWTAWYDLWIHKIHERVLNHIKALTEESQTDSGPREPTGNR
jgi:uncharacterized membrane protein YhaH (DUF805 family)